MKIRLQKRSQNSRAATVFVMTNYTEVYSGADLAHQPTFTLVFYPSVKEIAGPESCLQIRVRLHLRLVELLQLRGRL